MKLRAALLAGLVLQAASAFAQSSEPDSEWETFVPPASSTSSAPGSPIGATTPEGGFSAPERVIFSEKMRERVLDQLCRHIKLEYNYNLPGDLNGTGGGMKRWLAPLPDGRLTIVDEERLSVGGGHTFPVELADKLTAGLWVGAKLEGSSMVIRPLPGKQTCKEIDTLVDLRDVKTVLPFKGSRVSEMKVGELWRMPFTLTVGHTESLGAALADELGLTLSFNGTEQGQATLTLYRLSEKELRFRFRVDRVEIRTKGARLVKVVPAVEFASLGANILAQFVDHEIARQMRKYTEASLGFAQARSKGKRVVLEYVVDPTDPAAAQAVADALHGDFQKLVKMGWRMGTQQATDESTEAAYRDLQAAHDAQLGAAKFAAINAYTQRNRNIPLTIPFLTSHNWMKSEGEDTMTRYTDVQGEIHFDRADKSHQGEWFSLPWVGPLVKNQIQRDVQVVTAAKAGDPYGDPIVIYLQQHGFLRTTESDVKGKADEFKQIMALAGTRGNGPNPRMALPIEAAFPEPPPPGKIRGPRGQETDAPEPSDRKGNMSFTLVFNQEGVKQMLAASREDVLRSYAATVDSVPAMKWLMANHTVNERTGEVEYDWRAARKAFPDRDNDRGAGSRSWEEGEISRMAREASGLLADLAAARNAPDNAARSAAIAKAFSGQGASGLEYDRALRVFIQLVDPLNMTGDFTASVDRPKKETDVNMHLVLKRGRPDNELLRLAGEAKARFAQPSILTD